MKKDCTFDILSLRHMRERASNTLQMTFNWYLWENKKCPK